MSRPRSTTLDGRSPHNELRRLSMGLRRLLRGLPSRSAGMLFLMACLVVVAPFVSLLAGDTRLVPGSDYATAYLPFHDFAREEILARRLPLWAPNISGGAPLYASQQITLGYPLLTPLTLAFGSNKGIKLSLFAHIALCFGGQYLLARELNISRPGSAFAAVATAWGTFPMNHLVAGHITILFGYALAPLFFWLFLRLLASPGPGTAAALSSFTAIFELGSHPQVVFYALLAASCWIIGWFIFPRGERSRGGTVGWLGVAAGISLLLSAAQWLPAAELGRDGSHGAARGTADHAAMYSMDGGDLARMVAPRLKGDESLGVEPFERGSYDHERGAYLGSLILPLFAFSLSRARAARWQWAGAWLCLLAAEIALADHSLLWGFLTTTVPGLVWFRCQGRIFSVVTIIAALAAARGLDALVGGEQRAARKSLWHLACLAIAAAAVLGESLWRWLDRVDWHAYLRYASLHLRAEYLDLAALAVAVAAILYLCGAFGREFPRAAYLVAIVTLMVDLYEYNVRHFQLVPAIGRWQVALPRGALNRFVFAPGDLYCPRISLQYGRALPLAIGSRICTLNTNDGAVLPGAVSRLYAAIERNPRVALAVAACDWAYIESSGQWRELPGALPHFRFMRGEAVGLCDRTLSECEEHDLQSLRAALAGAVTLRGELPRRLEFDVAASEDGIFVVADTYYPGWTATIDGKQVQIRAVHGVFRGVKLGAGEHRVVFCYDPRSFKIGCALSGCGAIGLAGLAWSARREKTAGKFTSA